MNRNTLFVILFALCAAVGLVEALHSESSAERKVAKIGVYDSRSVAIAFVGSKIYSETDGKKLSEMMAEYEKAKAAGDQKKMGEFEAWGKSQQAKLHKQGFGTAPVDEILKHVEEQISTIAKEDGLSAIISKWDRTALEKCGSAERVDVTLKLIDLFKPNERQRKAAIEIQKHAPAGIEAN